MKVAVEAADPSLLDVRMLGVSDRYGHVPLSKETLKKALRDYAARQFDLHRPHLTLHGRRKCPIPLSGDGGCFALTQRFSALQLPVALSLLVREGHGAFCYSSVPLRELLRSSVKSSCRRSRSLKWRIVVPSTGSG